MSNEDDKVDSNAADNEEWSTVEKPSKANRRLAPQKMLTKSDFVESSRSSEPERRGKLVDHAKGCTEERLPSK